MPLLHQTRLAPVQLQSGAEVSLLVGLEVPDENLLEDLVHVIGDHFEELLLADGGVVAAPGRVHVFVVVLGGGYAMSLKYSFCGIRALSCNAKKHVMSATISQHNFRVTVNQF